MISAEDFQILCREDVRRDIESRLDADPLAVALEKRLPHAALVASQIKYLGRARRKLPSFFGARCIIPSRAYEQSSGEACAIHRGLRGGSVLDLTCGLGVDAYALSRSFGRVVAVERDPLTAEVARENMRRLGADNVEVVCAAAEDFAASLPADARFDWIYADPDRRGADGRKKVVAADCSPDIVRMLPRLRELSAGICIKLSPMFDVDEALRLFGPCSVEAVSWEGECKEVVVRIDGEKPRVTASAAGGATFSASPEERAARRFASPDAFDPQAYRWLVQPDVALQKAHLAPLHLAGRADIFGDNGYGFCREYPSGEVLGRIYEIASVERYDPKSLRRRFKGGRMQIMLRDVPLTASEIMRAAGVREGGTLRMAFTSAGREIWAVELK